MDDKPINVARPRWGLVVLGLALWSAWGAACSDQPLDSFPPADATLSDQQPAADATDAGVDGQPGDGCVPLTCKAAGKNCGTILDGCGGTVKCGPCPGGQVCGLGEVVNICGKLPPDPGKVAPALNRTVATTAHGATSFLYSGSAPIQTGVSSGAIAVRRAAVLRGRVLDRASKPLPGVKVTVLNHTEYGQTYSRQDGWFDLAVNGGEPLVLQLLRAGYPVVQRQVHPAWQEQLVIDDVALTPLDSATTTITGSAASLQVARGSKVTDSSGTRRATLLVAAGTTATMTTAAGTKALSSLMLRATELSSGADGPAAMPGDLPATAAYAYTVELSADEATAAGATKVTFDKPVIGYVEDFLKFPVGGQVPAAYHDRQLGRWIPSGDGLVVRILSTAGGTAALDLTGGGAAATATELAKLGISDAERKQLATLYAKDQRLWRVPLTRLGAWTLSWSWALPSTAAAPGLPDPPRQDPLEAPCLQMQERGAATECQNQALGVAFPVAGTPFSLRYQSGRAAALKHARTLSLNLSGQSVPAGLQSIVLEVAVAGRRTTKSFPATTGQKYTFSWDGKDAYGRLVQGRQPLSVRVGYKYSGTYHKPAPQKKSFGLTGSGALSASARQQGTLWQTFRTHLGGWDALGQRLGGFWLDVHHVYSPVSRVLLLGDGRRRSAARARRAITVVAGTGTAGHSGDAGPATSAKIYASHVAADGQGNLYITGAECSCVRKVDTKGDIVTVAGTGTAGFSGDKGPAKAAKLNQPRGAALDGLGNLYIADTHNHRLRRVDSKGIITTVAGIGSVSYSGDGGPATAAGLAWPEGVAALPDGTLYLADTGNNCVRRVGPAGALTRVAGAGCTPSNGCTPGWSGDGGPANSARVFSPIGVLPDDRGGLYIADMKNNRVRRVARDGTISTVAGTGTKGYAGDHGPAASALLDQPRDLALDRGGSLFIAENGNSVVRRVGQDAIITTVAGVGTGGLFLNKALAASQMLKNPTGVATGNVGDLYVSDDLSWRVGRVFEALPALSGAALTMASSDGTRIYSFDASGRHLATKDALSGATLYTFSYDAKGLLTRVTDGHSNATTVQRDSSGNPTALKAPHGQTTSLKVDAAGYLSSITNPANESHMLTFSAGGLLTGRTDPRNKSWAYTHGTDGRLTKAQDPAGGSLTLTRVDGTAGAFSVTAVSAESRSTTYSFKPLSGYRLDQAVTLPGGLQNKLQEKSDGTATVTLPDGAAASQQPTPDPRHGMQAPLAGLTSLGFKGSAVASAKLTASSWTDHKVDFNGRVFSTAYAEVPKRITQQSPAGRKATIDVDPSGRLFKQQLPGRAELRLQYDTAGRLASITTGALPPFRNHTLIHGTTSGLLASIKDPLNRTTSLTRDAAGRVTVKTLPGGAKVLFGRDKSGNLTSVTPPGRSAHVFTHDAVGMVTSYTPPAVGAGAYKTSYAYNNDHQPVSITRPDAKKVTISYDKTGRPGSVTLSGGGAVTTTRNATTGRLTAVTSPDGVTLSYTWGVADRPATVTWSGAIKGSLTRTHDKDLWLSSESIIGAGTITFGRDKDGLLTAAGPLSISREASSGLISGTTLGSATTTRTHDSHGALSSLKAAHGSTVLFSTVYIRDALNRIIRITEVTGGATSIYNYGYDAAGRLVSVTKNSAAFASYAYDQNGNRTSYTGAAGPAVIATHDAQDRLTALGSTSYTHTAAGELASWTTGGKTTTLTHDALGNLTAAALPGGVTVTYLHDGLGRRVGKKVGGSLAQGFLYRDRNRPVAELDSAGKVAARFIYGTRSHTPDAMVKGAKTYRIVSDHLGSPRLVVDMATGAVAQRMDYDPLGKVIKDTSPGFQPFGFAGGVLDQHTGLVRFGARDYDPRSGRWTTRRPMGFGPWSTNLYEYTRGDPVNHVDPSGVAVRRPGEERGPLEPGLERLTRGMCRAGGGASGAPMLRLPRYRPPAQGMIPCFVPSLGDLLCRPDSWRRGAYRLRNISFR